MMQLQLTAMSLLLLAGGASAEETYSAKSLFFGEDNSVIAVSTTPQKDKTPIAEASVNDGTSKATPKIASKKPSQPQHVGLSYFIRLKNPDGSTRDVLTSRNFKSGERFQLGLKVNRPSYIYVLNESPNGKVMQIYPQPGVDNFINAMGTVFLPGKGSFVFDHEPGTEQLLVYVSSTPVALGMNDRVKQMRPDMITASTVPTVIGASCPQSMRHTASTPNGSEQLASAETYASKGIAFAADPSCVQEAPRVESYASKGIAFSDDSDADGLQSASYVVKKTTTTDTNLFMKIKLQHQ